MAASTASTASPRRSTYLSETGVLSWLFSLDHKRIATLQLAGAGVAFALGLALAAMMAVARVTSLAGPISAQQFGAAMTLHGLGMVFLVLLPGISATLGAFIMPLQLGARGLAFPRLHLASLHLWGIAFLLMIHAGLKGAPAAGWTLAPPLGLEAEGSMIPLATAVILLLVAAMLRAIVMIVTLHQQRARGMRWNKVPPLALSLYAQSAVQLIAAPVLVLTLLLFITERLWPAGLFSLDLGGDPTLYRHFFWFGAHALVYTCALPAVGVMGEVIKSFARSPLFARRTLVIGIAVFAGLSLLAYGSPMIASASSAESAALFSLPSALIAVPIAMFFLVWLGTIRRGKASITAPLILALGAMSAWLVGSLAGLFLSAPSLALHLSGTTFTIAHAHYMIVGGIGLPAIAGIFLWWPKISGRMIPETLARWSALLLIASVHLSFFPLLILGSRGLPRAMATYPEQFAPLQLLSMVGMGLFTVAGALTVATLVTAQRRRYPVPANPLELDGLEWTTSSPPAPFNFTAPPES